MAIDRRILIEKAFDDLRMEVARAEQQHPPYASAHEGYAVILEELDELKAHVWQRAGARNTRAMRIEALQVAASAVRFAAGLCGKDSVPL